MRRIAAWGLVGLLGACGSPSDAGDTPGPVRTPTALSGSGTGTDCGVVVLRQGERLEVAGAMQRACLEAALREGRGAVLTVTAPTVEGDPVVTSWRLGADGTLAADIDASRDRFAGSQPRTRTSCGVVTAIPSPLECDGSG